MRGAEPELSAAENFLRFARSEVAGKSPLYAALCEGVAGDAELLAFLESRPPRERQPNLLLAAVRVLFGLQTKYAAFRAAVLEHRDEVAAVLATRRTQTNEPGRCAPLLPLLAALPQPLALLEVGASAGLCLLPDRYGYDYAGHRLGEGPPVLRCRPEGPVPLPRRLPEVAWRAGLDLEPIDVTDPEQLGWLELLIWPGMDHRLHTLRGAVEVARADPPRLVRGDLTTDDLDALAAEAPRDATLVIFHTAVLYYVPSAGRAAFRERVRRLGAAWLACEGPRVLGFERGAPA